MIRVSIAIAACACSAKAVPPGAGSGTSTVAVATCDLVRAKVESLYRAEALQNEPKRVDAAVADNTRMVMSDCAKHPDRVAPCIAKAATLAELEQTCLVSLDDEGTEGEKR
jgi:hypothetical protein